MPAQMDLGEWTEISSVACRTRDPLVTVLMLVHNHAHYLSEAVTSIILQKTEFNFELLIGEDSSTDESQSIAVELQNRYPNIIRILTSSANVGMVRNLRRLVSASRGQYIAYCEGDDYWQDKAKLQRQISFLRAHPDHGAVHTNYDHIVYRSGRWRLLSRVNSGRHMCVPSGDVFKELLCGNFIQTCTLCVRSDLVKALLVSGLSIDSYPVGDWPQCLYIAGYNKIGYIDVPTAVYRRTPGSSMNSGAQRRLNIARAYEPMLRDFFTHFDVESADQQAALSSLHRTLLSLALLAGDRRAFRASWDWLREHDAGETKPFRRQLMPWLMQNEVARKGLLMLLRLRGTLLEAWLYRKPVELFTGGRLGDSAQRRDR